MTKIEQQVMASVALIYTVRRLTSVSALKAYGLVFFVAATTMFVSLPHVASNFLAVWQGGVAGETTFILAAVTGTKTIVQIALLAGMLVTLSFVVDLVRKVPRRSSTQVA